MKKLKEVLKNIGFKSKLKEESVEIFFQNEKDIKEIQNIFESYLENQSIKERIKLKTKGGEVLVFLKDVLIVEKIRNKIYFYTEDIEGFLKLNLEEGEKLSSNFIRINKSQVVNTLKIKEITPLFNMKLLLELIDGSVVEVNRSYKKKFDDFIGGSYG